MKKSYTDKKRTTIALDPELTRRIEKMLKNKGTKLSKYAQEVLKSALAVDEMNQTVEFYKKLQDSGQYQKIKQLEGEVKKLKEYHITEKKINEQFKKLKSQKIDELSKKVKEIEDAKENETRWLELTTAELKDTKEAIREIMKGVHDGTWEIVSEYRAEQRLPNKVRQKNLKVWLKKLEKATGKKYKVNLKNIVVTDEMLDDYREKIGDPFGEEKLGV